MNDADRKLEVGLVDAIFSEMNIYVLSGAYIDKFRGILLSRKELPG